jgi:hypothetical protein
VVLIFWPTVHVLTLGDLTCLQCDQKINPPMSYWPQSQAHTVRGNRLSWKNAKFVMNLCATIQFDISNNCKILTQFLHESCPSYIHSFKQIEFCKQTRTFVLHNWTSKSSNNYLTSRGIKKAFHSCFIANVNAVKFRPASNIRIFL